MSGVKRAVRICLILLVLAFLISCILNTGIWVTRYTISSDRLPQAFQGCRLVQVSDLHSVRSDRQRRLLLERVAEERPDYIFLTGDLIDSRYYSAHSAPEAGERDFIPDGDTAELVRALTGLAPVYWVYGNHEMMLLDDPEHNRFKTALEEMGVTLLHQRVVSLTRDGMSVTLAGIQDPATLYKNPDYANLPGTAEKMKAMLDDTLGGLNPEAFTILLSHRPEYFALYQSYAVDLVLTGHAHGGQIRLPLIGGLYAPGQGWFPRYTSGVHRAGRLSMVVSRGLGNSILPLRIFDPPELVTVILERQQ